MSNLDSHRKMHQHRRLFAVIMMTIYLTIALSPLVSLSLYSKAVAHAVTGECVGDCDICGCSLESRANHTCCCANKKQVQAGVATRSKGVCCPPKIETTKKSCCVASKHIEPVVAKNDCCFAKNEQYQHDENVKEAQHKEDQSTTTVLKCGYPCGKGKLLSLAGFGSNELLPIIFNERLEVPHVETLFPDLTHRLASRNGEPPDPPPRLSQIS